MKNRAKMIPMVLLILVLLCGCSAQSEEKMEQKPQAKEQLLLWTCYETEPQKKALDGLVEEFNISQDKYHLSWEYHGPASEFGNRLMSAMISRHLPDVVIMDSTSMRKYMEKDMFEDITSYIENSGVREDYYEAAMESVYYKDICYGIPFTCYNQVLLYNREMFTDAGILPPHNWEEFLISARLLTNAEHSGFAMSALTSDELTAQILPWAIAQGDSLEKIGGEGTVRAFTMLQDLVKDEAMSGECINLSVNDVSRKFIASTCAMMVNGPGVLDELDGVAYGMLPFPVKGKKIHFVRGENIGVIRGMNVNGALAFIDFFKEEQVMGNESQLVFGLPPKEKLARALILEKPEYAPFLDEIEQYIKKEEIEQWAEFSDCFAQSAMQIIAQSASPEQAAEALCQMDSNN